MKHITGYPTYGKLTRKSARTISPDELVSLLMLLPEDVRVYAARVLWFDLVDENPSLGRTLKGIADTTRIDGDYTFSVEDNIHALIIVGYPSAKAIWRSKIFERQMKRQDAGTSLSERRRLEALA